ncbi:MULTISPECIES: hypothetical protein [unclassified Actinoplanes]|uniref:hypothetical protein n=1 Tax=unclassified Actinoplanes TaxID=2626549 RepID=UPI0005B8C02E|nr:MULTISPECIES: hypothetical protein [unclassified Actinoplanes]
MVTAAAMVLTFSTGASASTGVLGSSSASAVKADTYASTNAAAQKVYDETFKSLESTGSASFTAADGSKHTISVSDRDIVLDGKSAISKSAARTGSVVGPMAGGTSVWCKAKIAAAVAALAAVGVAFIAFMITGLSESAMVAIAGITMRVSSWQAVIAGGISVAAIGNLIKEYVC